MAAVLSKLLGRTVSYRELTFAENKDEMIRAGIFGTTVKTYGDPGYTTFVLAILTLFGLWLLREGRKYVVVE